MWRGELAIQDFQAAWRVGTQKLIVMYQHIDRTQLELCQSCLDFFDQAEKILRRKVRINQARDCDSPMHPLE